MLSRAIVINVDTGPVTALALLSLQRYCTMPFLLVDCSTQAAEQTYARQLADHLGVELELRPLKPHGQTLDNLFLESRSESILIMDSDVELLSDGPVRKMTAGLCGNDVFAVGFSSDDHMLDALNIPYALYAARMWIPLCLFKVGPVRKAIEDGISFMHHEIYNDLPGHQLLSKWLFARHRLPMGSLLKLRFLDRYSKFYGSSKPSFINYDTGALLYAYLLQQGYHFHQLDWILQQQSVAHYHGVTRSRLNWFDNNSTRRKVAFRHAMQRIREHYPGCLPESLMR
ncbi:MAG: hypothetical protein PF630_07405 [Gammaproteobacteria bacterium]|jgi:hypothetical protein|nr:hypothetical protein [Gammaproteobacteria bacterium]